MSELRAALIDAMSSLSWAIGYIGDDAPPFLEASRQHALEALGAEDE